MHKTALLISALLNKDVLHLKYNNFCFHNSTVFNTPPQANLTPK